MPCQRITIDLAFDADAAGALTRPGAAAPYAALLAAIAAARPFACWVQGAEDTASAGKHLCAHTEGGQCAQPTEIGSRPVRRIAVPVEAVAEEIGK